MPLRNSGNGKARSARDILLDHKLTQVAVTLKQNPRFHQLVEEIKTFQQLVHSKSSQSVAEPSKMPAPKRRRIRRSSLNPITSASPDVLASFGDDYNEWRANYWKRLLADLISLLKEAEQAVNNRKFKRQSRKSSVNQPRPKARSRSNDRHANVRNADNILQASSVDPTPLNVGAEYMPEADLKEWLNDAVDVANDPGIPILNADESLDDLWKIIRDFDVSSVTNISELENETTILSNDSSSVSFRHSSLFNTDGASGYGIQSELLDPTISDKSTFEFFDLEDLACSHLGAEDMDIWTSVTSLSPSPSLGILPAFVDPTVAPSPLDTPGTSIFEVPLNDALSAPHPSSEVLTDCHPDAASSFLSDTADLNGGSIESCFVRGLLLASANDSSNGQSATPDDQQAMTGAVESPVSTIRPIVLRKRRALERAEALRDQIIKEITRAKLMLWEYTIEASVTENLINVQV